MNLVSGETRLRDVCSAFSRLADKNKGLRSLAHEQGADPARCAVLLVNEDHGAQVRLDIFILGAHVKARSGLGSASVGSAQIEDHLTVNLTAGYNWDDATFETPDEMAFILFKHMLRRMVAAADMQSDGNGARPH